jgi:hypothetical protein
MFYNKEAKSFKVKWSQEKLMLSFFKIIYKKINISNIVFMIFLVK